ncbi:MAG: PilZ domain-containing protein [Planctomycetota bacterium]|nr:PilZ domain-containing protein [Planctomycetota bacterium]MDA1139562.1 PilZ domain-containing protein [Planctomycetota bacterium]
MSDGRERRRAPRKDTRFTVRNIRHDGDDNGGHSEYCETRNVSRNGAYCLSEKPFPEFARIKITLEFSETGDEILENLDCEGVVVRADGAVNVNGKEMHAFALFFDRMSEEDRCKIDRFVEEHRSGEPEEAEVEE